VKPAIAMQDAVRDLALRLDVAPRGQKTMTVKAFADQYHWSTQKVYRELKKVGRQTHRKRRADAGTTSQDEETLTALAATLKLGVRKNGKATMEVPNARSLLAANGRKFTVGNSRIRTLLRQSNLDLASQKQPTPHTNMRSLHPNHVHMVDPSLCLLYYSPDGKQRVLRDDEIYKNKPDWVQKIGNLKCWRYVLIDHYSNVVAVRYYQAAGEKPENLYDFLLWSWQRLEGNPFHGVPRLLVWDKGSANTASAIKRAMKALQVEHYEHKAGNPRAKGGVEEANNLVEKLFESRLLYEPVHSIDELNAAATAWQIAYNADQLPEYDARLKRPAMRQPLARFEIWQRIRQDQLRLLPDIEVCRYLLSAEPKPRKVRGDMMISFAHPVAKQSLMYDLRGIEGIVPRQAVTVSPLVMGRDYQVIVGVEDYQGNITEHVISPTEFDEVGLRLDAPIWGQEWDRQPDTDIDTAGKQADQAAFPDKTQEEIEKAKAKNEKPFGGLDAHTHLSNLYIPDYMQRPGTELHVPDRTRVEIKPLSHIDACRALVGKLGRSLSAEENAWIRDSHPDGVPEEELPVLADQLENVVDRPGLALVK
ncbi:MAG: DDE-type integrase/transposase/recombinase, partial [Candidatus Thiodiazotropha sp. (ex Lucinoma annulata)]|nr:DDE-type integrase/transposase/recombinase [Candidatus Thiodiazotropha sp. (ex Lucinoma annulata)]